MATRINPNLLPNLLLAIEQSKQNEATATQQLASGLSVNELSDNPSAVANLVQNHNQAGQDDQYLQNISSLQGRFQAADSALSNVVTVLTRAVSLGTEGANGVLSPADQQAIAQEVQGLQTQLVGLANTTYQGTYLFSGTAVTTQPFTLNTTTGAVAYNGNTGVSSVQLSNGNSINTNLPGSQLFQNASGNAFSALQNLVSALQTGGNVAAAVTQVGAALTTLGTQRVFYGNALNQVDLSENFLNQDKINLSSQQNTLVGANPAQVVTNLEQAEVAGQATVTAAGQILSLPNLLNFLK
jgi:flagellar hook-associated protein 3 FlgL